MSTLASRAAAAVLASALLAAPAFAEIVHFFDFGTTPFPGSATPIAGELRGSALHDGGVLLATRTTATTSVRFSLLQYKNGALTVALNESGGFPGGGDIQGLQVAPAGDVVYVVPSHASGASTSNFDALVRYSGGAPTVLIANSDTIMNKGSLTLTRFSSASGANGAVAFTGVIGAFSHYMFKYSGNNHTLVAQESVTVMPGATDKFGSMAIPSLSPDGRVFFYGTNGKSGAALRTGRYVAHNGALSVVFDSETTMPGSTEKFNGSGTTRFFFSPDGAHVAVAATGVGSRQGLYRFESGALTTLIDSSHATYVDFDAEDDHVVVTNDGTVYFYAREGNRNDIVRVPRGGALETFYRGDATLHSPSRLWLDGADLYFNAFTPAPAFERVFVRRSTSGGDPVVALNLSTHPALATVQIKSFEKVQFSASQVLFQTFGSDLLLADRADLAGSGGGNNPGGGASSGRLVNLSIRATAGTGANTLIVGLGLGGANTTGSKSLLVRASGPTLGSYGLAGTLPDPTMTAYQGQVVIDQNDDWTGTFDFNAVGAFPFIGSPTKEAAIYRTDFTNGLYTIHVSGKDGTSGYALAEVYDATPAASVSASTPRLVNVSARTFVGTDAGVLIAGFSVTGTTPAKVLIRAVGPTLGAAPYNLPGTLANPQLKLYQGQTVLLENDNWGGTAEIKAAAAGVYAFDLMSDTSADAVILTTLEPGNYTAQVSGAGGTTGIALVEVYEVR